MRTLKCGKLQCFQQQYIGRCVGVRRRGELLDGADERCSDKVDFSDFAAAVVLVDLVEDFNAAVDAAANDAAADDAAADDVVADAAVLPVLRFLRGALADFFPAAD